MAERLRADKMLRLGLIWLAVFALSLPLDVFVAESVSPYAREVKRSDLAREIKHGGHFGFTLFVAVFVCLLHRSSWRGAAALCLAGMISGLIYSVMKMAVGRKRPVVEIVPFSFDPFPGGFPEFFFVGNMSFPSGHAALGFASAVTLSYLMPRAAWAFYTLAVLLAAERVAENAHYLSDVVASAAVGYLSARLAIHIISRFGKIERALSGLETENSSVVRPA